LAILVGLDQPAIECVTIAVTELATNLVRYAHRGEIILAGVQPPERAGIRVESRDAGPGIEDVELAMRDGFSTGGGLGSGLPAIRRLMDEFSIESSAAGTTIVTWKWLSR
jgi:serine/threonine-protein kinase RsbT